MSEALPVLRYECDKCGACCRHLIVEADAIDVMREPRIGKADQYYSQFDVEKTIDMLREDEGRAVIIACGTACPFQAENLCSIHPTRPNVCVAFEAGGEQCQEVRAIEGLTPLEPR